MTRQGSSSTALMFKFLKRFCKILHHVGGYLIAINVFNFLLAINIFHDRDKRKDFASNYAAYYPFGVDVFLTPRKIDHIAQHVELPAISSSGKLPPILVVNVQVFQQFATHVSFFCINKLNMSIPWDLHICLVQRFSSFQ